MDARVPEGPGPFAAAVIVHGGGWVRGDRKTTVEPLFRPLTDAGLASFSISYRLAGQLPMFGDAIRDVEQAVLYVRQHAAEYRVDPNRLVLIGESAGGQLASMAALSTELRGLLRGVVALYSPSDLVSLAKTSGLVPPSLREAIRSSPLGQLFLAGLERFSPMQQVRADMPPFLLIHGDADALVPFSQSMELCSRMKSVGAACEVYSVAGGGHGIRWWESQRKTAYKVHMVRWIAKQVAPAVAASR